MEAQGGDSTFVYDTSLFPTAAVRQPVIAGQSGYVHRILAEEVGLACMVLGGGRKTKESEIDLTVGICLEKKNGDAVRKGDTVAFVYAGSEEDAESAAERVLNAYDLKE